MSAEEDTELRDLLTQTLENNGSLAKIRAQLRACVFLAFDEDELVQKKQPLLNSKLKLHSETPEGKLMFCIVREFLEYFNLNYTVSVFEPESYSRSDYYYEGRTKLIKDLKLDINETIPVLLQLIKIAQEHNSDNNPMDGNESNKENLETNIKVYSTESGGEFRNGGNHMNTNHPRAQTLDQTFVLGSSKSEALDDQVETPRSVESINGKDDTYEGTSSIAEDSEKEKNLIDLNKTIKTNSSGNTMETTPRTLLDSTINEISSPILKNVKLSLQKQDKLKTKSSITSLSDFPPLQLNKFRNNESMVLPSLHTGELKDQASEAYKILENDLMDNYEEDFMSGSEVDLKSEKSLKLTNLFLKQKKDVKDKSDTNNISLNEPNDSVASSVTSEDFELNSNIDDILNSNGTN